jgi:hypothetical protein
MGGVAPTVRENDMPATWVRGVLACFTAFPRVAGWERVGAFLCLDPTGVVLERRARRSRRMRAVSSACEVAVVAASIVPVLRAGERLGRREVVMCGTSVPSDRDRLYARAQGQLTG